MTKRVKYCWIVETNTPRGWEPSYASEVNCSKSWADKDREALQAKYPRQEYRIAKYIAAPRKKGKKL